MNQMSGVEFARNAAQGVRATVQKYAAQVRLSTDAGNASQVKSIETGLKFLYADWKDVIRRLREIPSQSFQRPSLKTLVVASALTLASFGFAEVAFKQFNWGKPGHLLAAGFALLAPCSAHFFLKYYPWLWVTRTIGAIAFFTAMAAMFPLADLRTLEFARPLSTEDAVIFDNPAPASSKNPPSTNEFENLRWFTILSALGLELTSALAWTDYVKTSATDNSPLRRALEKRKADIELEIRDKLEAKEELLAEPSLKYQAIIQAFQSELYESDKQ